MKTFSVACATAVLAAISMSAMAAEPMPMMDHGDEMKKMDANGDGMLSKAEFTKYHDAMWTKMPKTSNGMVDLKAMQSMKGQMGNGSMQGGSKGSDGMGNMSSMGQGSMSSGKEASDTTRK